MKGGDSMSKNLSDIIGGNYNHCNTCKWMEQGNCTKLNRSVISEMDSDLKVDDCPKKSGRYPWN